MAAGCGGGRGAGAGVGGLWQRCEADGQGECVEYAYAYGWYAECGAVDAWFAA